MSKSGLATITKELTEVGVTYDKLRPSLLVTAVCALFSLIGLAVLFGTIVGNAALTQLIAKHTDSHWVAVLMCSVTGFISFAFGVVGWLTASETIPAYIRHRRSVIKLEAVRRAKAADYWADSVAVQLAETLEEIEKAVSDQRINNPSGAFVSRIEYDGKEFLLLSPTGTVIGRAAEEIDARLFASAAGMVRVLRAISFDRDARIAKLSKEELRDALEFCDMATEHAFARISGFKIEGRDK